MPQDKLSLKSIIQKKTPVLILVLSLFLIFYSNGKSEVPNMRPLYASSTGNCYLMHYDRSTYYIENHQTFLGDYSILYLIDNEKTIRVLACNNYSYFAGILQKRIILRLVDSSYTNYPTNIRYTLYNPITGLKEAMPKCIEKLIQSTSHVMLQGYDDFVIINVNNVLYLYDPLVDLLEILDEYPFEFVNLSSTFCIATRGNDSWIMYSVEGRCTVSKVYNMSSTPKIWLTGTQRFFSFSGSPTATIVEECDISNDFMSTITEEPYEHTPLILLSIDSFGDYLYIVTSTAIKRYNLQLHTFDQMFDFELNISNNGYVADITIYENKIIYLVHDNSKNQLVTYTLFNQ